MIACFPSDGLGVLTMETIDMNSVSPSLLPVVQADRERAADFRRAYSNMDGMSVRLYRTGKFDADVAVQAFARCRLEVEAATRPKAPSLSGDVGFIREALEPFARLAGPINGEPDRPTYLEAIDGPNGTGEFQLTTYVGDGTRIEVLTADDFHRAATALERMSGVGRDAALASSERLNRWISGTIEDAQAAAKGEQ